MKIKIVTKDNKTLTKAIKNGGHLKQMKKGFESQPIFDRDLNP